MIHPGYVNTEMDSRFCKWHARERGRVISVEAEAQCEGETYISEETVSQDGDDGWRTETGDRERMSGG